MINKDDPSTYITLWLRQNNAVELLADQKAFDALPSVIREMVNEAPVQLACCDLLRGCRRLGAGPIAAALERERW